MSQRPFLPPLKFLPRVSLNLSQRALRPRAAFLIDLGWGFQFNRIVLGTNAYGPGYGELGS
jgi:hypothetical protein